MIGSRLQPLVLLLVLGGALLLVRLYQVQVVDNEVWALEAARLVHAGREVPYRRGAIHAGTGEVLARDQDGFALELTYRTFRREHPLGQVAHALSLIEGRTVSLEEARFDLARKCLDLASLTPADHRAFGRGERFYYGGRTVPATPDPAGELRARRARDLSFYLRELFTFKRGEWTQLERRALEGRQQQSFLDLAAGWRRTTAEEESQRLVERVERSLTQLERLARLLEWPDDEDARVPSDPLDRIVYELERVRRWVEDASASKLFDEAAGFSPGRVDDRVLTYYFDVSWIARRIGWDASRVAEWAATARRGWLESWRDGHALPRLVWSLAVDPARTHDEEELCDRLAVLFQAPEALGAALDGELLPWRELGELVVFEDLAGALAADVTPEARRFAARCLPIQLEALRTLPPMEGKERGLLVRTLTPKGREGADELQAALVENLRPGKKLYVRHVEGIYGAARAIAEDWEGALQAGLESSLNAILAEAAPRELSASGALRFAEGNVRRALEHAEFYLKDFGMRPRKIVPGDPSYDVIYLLTHYEKEFPGFRIRDESRRIQVELEGDDRRPADRILGSVSSVSLRDYLVQRREASVLSQLKRLPERTEEEERELRSLIGEVYLPHEIEGVSGIEAFFDRELTGRNGYEESLGLENRYGEGRRRHSVREAEDGLDVHLTLDVGLQGAAQRTLRDPVAVPDDPKFDWEWHAEPVGAITFVSLEGDVLVAASEPDEGSVSGENATGQRLQRIERTLRKPTFQPPGSVFKPFVAAYALEHGLDPSRTVHCAPLPDGRAGYVDLHCWNEGGHGDVDLHAALVHSCNSYFAWLGETFRDADFHQLARSFGFGQPTGVSDPMPWDREETRRFRFEDTAGFARRGGELLSLRPRQRRMAGNGLGVVEATPMQVTRGILALARGELIPLRLVRQVGGTALPQREARRVEIAEGALARVRKALRGVVAESGGTARTALGPRALGLDISAKTGSADIRTAGEGESRIVRKHTWVAGWVPAENPVAAFCVFEHDTRATSSHGAVYLTRQFLQQPEVLDWLEARGVDVSRARAR